MKRCYRLFGICKKRRSRVQTYKCRINNVKLKSAQMPNSFINGRIQLILPGNARVSTCFRFAILGVLMFTCAAIFWLPAVAQVQSPEGELPSPEIAQRLKKLESELRCLVCQNQTLAESPAGLAGDLRREVRSLIGQGKTDDQIKSYLQARYGDFVLYNPPIDPKTYLLWFGPFALLGGGAILVWRVARRRQLVAQEAASPGSINTAAKSRACSLLDDDEEAK